MKTIYPLFFLFILLLVFSSNNTSAQTNVSGGIYANTTWTKAKSPYIVIDTVVVFPGVTLTIEPGVTVKFDDNKHMEIRQATLIALGTKTDSITFTSNSSNPKPGIWNGVIFNIAGTLPSEFSYCNFHYALGGIQNQGNLSMIKNSNFTHNFDGAGGFVLSDSSGNLGGYVAIIDSSNFNNNSDMGLALTGGLVENCNFINNITYGIVSVDGRGGNVRNCLVTGSLFGIISSGDTLQNCIIKNNNTGVLIVWYSAGYYHKINNCVITNNKYGINKSNTSYTGNVSIKSSKIDSNTIVGIRINLGDTILACEIKNNGTGIGISANSYDTMRISANIIENNSIGIADSVPLAKIYCNKICNNTLYDFVYRGSYTTNIHIASNYWCITDSATLRSMIYDGYKNISLGLVNFMPLDTQQCYLTGCNLQLSYTSTGATCDTCQNGSATISISNGIAPYTITWYSSPIQTNQTAHNLAPGTYTVCVVDGNGCSACLNSVLVDSINCKGLSIRTNGANATCSTCNDGEAWANITGGTPPYQYTWYTSPFQSTDTATGLTHGQYSVCVSDKHNCLVCDSVTIGTGSCSAHFNLYPDTLPHNYLAKNMASGASPITYLWSWGDGTSDTAAYPSHTYAAPGSYTICLTITDGVGCTNTYCVSYFLKQGGGSMVHITVVKPDASTGVNELKMENGDWKIYPNPASGAINILFSNYQHSTIKIFDLLGEEVYNSAFTGQSTAIDVSNFTSGVYMIEAVSGNKVSRQKFVKGS